MGAFTDQEKLFEPHDRGTKATRVLAEVGLFMKRGDAGGLFIMIGRKKGSPAQAQAGVSAKAGARESDYARA